MGSRLYTSEEIVKNIKDLDITLNGGISRSELDTSQTQSVVNISIGKLQNQRTYWAGMLQSLYPQCYRDTFRLKHRVSISGRR